MWPTANCKQSVGRVLSCCLSSSQGLFLAFLRLLEMLLQDDLGMISMSDNANLLRFRNANSPELWPGSILGAQHLRFGTAE